MDYLLDTNIIIIYSRDNDISRKIEDQYQIFSENNRLAVSVVTLGEIDAVIKKFKLGKKRKARIDEILSGTTTAGIEFQEIISMYGNIDAFSQGKTMNKGVKFSSKNMGKNDMWIAATANIYDLTLLTTDKDFQHLSGHYINLEYIDLDAIRKS